MDALTTQIILVWTLLGFLLVWMVTFAVLAFYPRSKGTRRVEDGTIRPKSFPVTPASKVLHVISSSPVSTQFEADRHNTGEMKAITVR